MRQYDIECSSIKTSIKSIYFLGCVYYKSLLNIIKHGL